MVAALATPHVVPAIVPVTWVPWPLAVAGLSAEDGESLADAAREVGVPLVEARVDRVRVDPGPGRARLELAVERELALVDAIEPPGHRGLD